jgi:tetratricopeptide (TPR) repeat protein
VIQEGLARENPSVTEYQSTLGRSYINIGELHMDTGNPADALTAFGEAMAIYERLARENPSITDFQRGLARSHYGVGRLLWKTGKPTDALAAFQEAITIYERLARENPTVTEMQIGLASSQNCVGNLLRETGRPSEALAAFEEAIAIYERLVRENPTIPNLQSELAGTLNNVAMLNLDAQHFAEARDQLSKAIEYQKRALASNTRHPRYRRFLKNHYTNLLMAARGLNDATLVTQALRGLAEIAASDPQYTALDERMTAVLGGQAAKDAPELLAFAQRAYETQKFTLAVRFFSEALERDAALADDRRTQHAYNAACCAALAGTGQGLDDPQPDEAAKSKFRSLDAIHRNRHARAARDRKQYSKALASRRRSGRYSRCNRTCKTF